MITSDQCKEIRVNEVLAHVGLPLAKINFRRRGHGDGAYTLAIVEPRTM